MADQATQPVCSTCGRVADGDDDPLVTWSTERLAGRADGRSVHDQLRWTCPDCTRRHVRAIEAKLDQQWW